MKIFEIQPASNSVLFIIVPISLLLIFIIFVLIFALISAKNAKFIISENTLDIKASFYSRKIALAEIKIKEIKLINLATDTNWNPKWRTNGIGLFGYNEGWFKLKNGIKGLLFITRKNEVVLIPTINNYYILVSPKNPTEFIQALQEK